MRLIKKTHHDTAIYEPKDREAKISNYNEVKTSNTYDLRFLQVDVTNKSKKVFIHERIKQHTLSFCQNKFYYF